MQTFRSLIQTPRLFSNAVILTVIIGSLTSIIMFREIWPFSHYPMFSGMQRDLLVRTRLFGVTNDSEQNEIPLLSSFIYPLGEPEIVHAMRRVKSREGGQRQLELAVTDCLRRYEKRRQNGDHTGPPLRGIRLYRLQWDLEPTAVNADRPTNKQLLVEVMAPQEATE